MNFKSTSGVWIIILSFFYTIPVFAKGNEVIPNFNEAKKVIFSIHQFWPKTLYCRCQYVGKLVDWKSCGYTPRGHHDRASRIEIEHVVPAESFGQSFKEWREGDPLKCRSKGKKKFFKGRKCAEKNSEFNRIEADLYNLFPEVGEVNMLRSNYSMEEIGVMGGMAGISFGGCKARVYQRKFEPMNFAKGTVARTYLYMDWAYPKIGVISNKNRKLFEAWDKQYPIENWECERYEKILKIQKNENPILKAACEKK